MTDKLKQTIKEEVMKLPKENQEAVNAFDWVKVAEEIGKKYLINESEINNFQVETMLVLVGLEEGESYARNIENNVGTSKAEAEKIAAEAVQQIFIPISNLIEENIKKNIQNKNPNLEQTMDFILSGGDYSAFITPAREVARTSIPPVKSWYVEKENATMPITTPTLADIKANAQKINQ